MLSNDDLTYLYWLESDHESTIMEEWWTLDDLLYECAYLDWLVNGDVV